jgi:2-(1,2-epoxy-1,2-dihydrophenyl)acetyl-CoA isomerase
MSLIHLETIEINQSQIEVLYLNNPQTKNSMTWEMGEEFFEAIQSLKKRYPLPRCLILSGKNDIFSSGGNLDLLKSFSTKTYEQNKRDMFKFYNFFLSIRTLPFPVIAAVNGHAVGAAFSLALASDIRVFSSEAKYSFNFVKLGIHPGMGSSFIVKELFGIDKANQLLFLAESITGSEAYKMGLCYDAVPQDDVIRRAIEIAISVTESGPLAVRLLKENIYSFELLQDALKKEADAQAKNFQTRDFLESIKAIEEKRKAIFKDS